MRNLSDHSIALRSLVWLNNPSNVFNTNFAPLSLESEANTDVTIAVLATASGVFSANLQCISTEDTNTCTVKAIAHDCGADPETSTAVLQLLDLSAQPGDTINLSATLSFIGTRRDTVTRAAYTCTLEYPRHLLYRFNANDACAGTDEERCVYSFSGEWQSDRSHLFSLPYIATLGNTDHATLSIKSFEWTGSGPAQRLALHDAVI